MKRALDGHDLMIITFVILWACFYAAFWRGYRWVKISEEARPMYDLSDGATIVSSR